MQHHYDYIPASVIVFQSNRVVFYNKYIGDIFLASDKKDLIDKVLFLLSLENELELYQFLLAHTHIQVDKHEIEIKSFRGEDYDLFLFTKLDKELVLKSQDQFIVKNIRRDSIEVLSFFRGIKLYSKDHILKTENGKLFVNISKKQKLNLLDNKEFFIKLNGVAYSALCSVYSKEKSIVGLDNLQVEEHDPFNRDEIRLKFKTNKVLIPFINKKLKIYDISQKSICFISKNSYQLENIEGKSLEINLPFLDTNLYISYFKKVDFDGKFKYVFKINNPSRELIDFLQKTQKEILQDISKYLQKL
jgi:hypothetical protein